MDFPWPGLMKRETDETMRRIVKGWLERVRGTRSLHPTTHLDNVAFEECWPLAGDLSVLYRCPFMVRGGPAEHLECFFRLRPGHTVFGATTFPAPSTPFGGF